MGSKFDAYEEKGRDIVEKFTKKAEPLANETKAKAGKAVSQAADKAKKTAMDASKAAMEKVNEMSDMAKDMASDTRKRVRRVSVDSKVYVQYQEKEVDIEEIADKAAQAYAKTNDTPLKKIRVYIKPEENAAYYVINDTIIGQIDI